MAAVLQHGVARPFAAALTSRAQSAPRVCTGSRVPPAVKPVVANVAGSFVHRLSTGRRAVRAASSDLKFEGLDDGDGAPGSEYTSVFALAAFAASYFEQIHINVPFLLKAFAWFTILNSAAAIIYNRGDFDKVGRVIAPAVLAANVALRQYDTATITVGLVGWYLARELKGPFWGWIATLVAALYFDYGVYWIIAAYAFGTITRLLDGLEKNKVPVISIPVLAVSAFAVANDYKNLWVVSLALGEIVRSFYGLAKRLKDEEPKGLTKHS